MSLLRDDRAATAIRVFLFIFVVGAVAGVGARLGLGDKIPVPVGAMAGLVGGLVAGIVSRLAALFRYGRAGGLHGSAWAWFTLNRTYLAIKGKLPWRPMVFLEDAHERGMMRRSGAVYQFRHARLQDQFNRSSSESGSEYS